MTDLDFKRRFLAALANVPHELDPRLDEFVQFDMATVNLLDKADATLLLAHGLPREASPFLRFEAYSLRQMVSKLETFGISQLHFPIGYNGCGDILVIDLKTREVVYFNHDFDNARVFINSSLRQFLECLCIYQEHLTQGTMTSCLGHIAKSDHKAALSGAMWHTDIENEVLGE